MDQKKIGKFIAEERKKQNLTQAELAEILGVSDRSVSKWETGKCMMDLSLFQPLCTTLKITINELLSGEKITEENYQHKLEENMISIAINFHMMKRMFLKLLKFIIVFILSCILLLIGFIILFPIIQNNRYQQIPLDENLGSASICQYGDNLLKLSIQTKEGIPALVATKIVDGKEIYTLYRLKDSKLMYDSAWGGTYLIRLKLRGVQASYMEVPEEIYYYSNLIWKKGMDLPLCNEEMEK